MVVYGYAKDYYYTGDGTLMIQVRVPVIHGPYRQADYKGKRLRTYTQDKDLPFYQSVLLPYLPNDGDVVALVSYNDSSSQFLVVGLTGGSYSAGATNVGGI